MVADIIDIHIRHEDHTRQIVALAEIPRLLCSDLHAGLAGNHDDRGIGCGRGLLRLTDKIKEAGGIQTLIFSLSHSTGTTDVLIENLRLISSLS